MNVKYFKEDYHFPLCCFLYVGLITMVCLIIVEHDDALNTLLYSLVISVLIIGYFIMNITHKSGKRVIVERLNKSHFLIDTYFHCTEKNYNITMGSGNMVQVYAVRIKKEVERSFIQRLSAYLSTEEQHQIGALKSHTSAYQSLIGKLLTRYLLGKKLHLPNTELYFHKNDYGKPLLTSNQAVHFNVSHSNEWVVCCVSKGLVGVDIEKIILIDLSLAKRVFTEQEYNHFLTKNEQEKIMFFYLLWCAKESYLKAIGKGMFRTLDSFSMSFNKDKLVEYRDDKHHFYLKEYQIHKTYKLVVCAENRNFVENIYYICEDDLAQSFLL